MKDSAHHRKSLQRKVIQSTRKENNKEVKNPPVEQKDTSIVVPQPKRKFELNRRVPRVLRRQPLL